MKLNELYTEKKLAQASSIGLGLISYGITLYSQNLLTHNLELLTAPVPAVALGLFTIAFVTACSYKGLKYEYQTLKESGYSANPITTMINNKFNNPKLAVATSFIVANAVNFVNINCAAESLAKRSFAPLNNTLIAGYGSGFLLTLASNRVARSFPRNKIKIKIDKTIQQFSCGLKLLKRKLA